jgi:TP901 family phage tail tape measure protein
MSFSNEIADVEGLKKAFDGLDGSLNKNATDLLKLIKVYEDLNKVTQNTAQTAENLGKAQKATSDAAKQKEAIDKQVISTTEKLTAVENKSIKPLLEKKIALQAATKALTDEIKAEGLAETSLVRMRQKLSELTAQYDKAGVRTKEAAKEINNLSREIGHAEEATNRHQRGVGGYRDQLGELSHGLVNGTVTFAQFGAGVAQAGKAMLAFFLTPVGMIVGAIGGLVLAGKILINNAQDFQRAGSSLSAITGAVGKDLKFMKDKAREFAKESESSATEILVAFEKVGSKLPELLKNGPLLAEVSRNAIILSESTQGKLSVEDAAVAASAALNAFSIPLTDSKRAINTLAAASLAGGAEVMDLVDSFKNLAPVAVSANMSLEQSAAALEVLEKFQLKAEKGGMQLKGSLLQLQQAGLGFASGQFDINDALIEAETLLNKIVDPIKRAAEQEKIFGRENITAGLIMMNNRQRFIDLTATIEEQVKKGTIAQDIAKTATDNLQGSYKQFGNGWRGLLLQLEDSDGVIMKVWRGIVDFGTWVLNVNEAIFKGIGKMFDIFKSKKDILAREDKKIADEKALNDEAAADKAAKLAAGQAAMDDTARKKKEEDDKKAADKKEKDTADRKKAEDEAMKKRVDAVEMADLKEKEKINKKHIDGISDEKQYQAELIDQEKKFLNNKQALYKPESKEYQDIELQKQAITIKSQDDILKAIEERFKQQKAIEEQGTKDLQDLLKDQTTAEEKAADEAIKVGEKLVEDKKKLDEDYAKSKKEKDKDVRDASIDLARDSINAVFEMQNMKLEKEMSDLEKQKDKELSNKNLTESQKLKIEADFDKKAGAIKTKQAQQAKLQALFDIAIGTAVSVMNAKGNIPLMIILAAMGAVQAALVAARPIPKYAKGTKSAERAGIFGEAGTEIMFPVGGGAIIADKPTYFEGDKFLGAQIKNSTETKELMNMVADRNIIVKNQHDDRLLNEMKEVKNAIINKKEWITDTDHRIIGHKMDNSTTIYLNRLIRTN